jgi:hypothetical protein
VTCLWNRFLELQDEKEEDQIACILQALEESSATPNPISSSCVVQERNIFLKERYQNLKGRNNNLQDLGRRALGPSNSLRELLSSRQVEQAERVASNHANLAVPRETGDYMYYAQ